jgi:hypothetical protein
MRWAVKLSGSACSQSTRAPKSAQLMQSHFANVNGVRLHYLVAGRGSLVVLLHGYAETSHMWRPLITELEELSSSITIGYACTPRWAIKRPKNLSIGAKVCR